jgi:nitrate reductase delta subunit
MKTFKVLSVALSYPEPEWLPLIPEMQSLVAAERLVKEPALSALMAFFEHLGQTNALALQEHYVETFDRSTFRSLNLFEHVHGESRDRGQAMVELMQRYETAGLHFAFDGLPDYLPVFLEYLSLLPLETALANLSEVSHLLHVIGERLCRCGSPYEALLAVLLALAGEPAIRSSPDAPAPLEDCEAMDRQWAEEPVRFGMGCDPKAAVAQSRVIHFHKGAGS